MKFQDVFAAITQKLAQLFPTQINSTMSMPEVSEALNGIPDNFQQNSGATPKEVADLQSSLEASQTEISSQKTTITSLETANTQLQEQVTNMSTELEALKTDLLASQDKFTKFEAAMAKELVNLKKASLNGGNTGGGPSDFSGSTGGNTEDKTVKTTLFAELSTKNLINPFK